MSDGSDLILPCPNAITCARKAVQYHRDLGEMAGRVALLLAVVKELREEIDRLK